MSGRPATGPATAERRGTGTATPAVALEDVHLHYFSAKQETEALQGITFDVTPGEFVAIVGPSGCGKSTVLSLISGLMEPTHGQVLVDGVTVRGPSRRVGYMLQHDHLFEWRTVLDNVMLGPEIQGLDRAQARSRAVDLLERYGLGEFQEHRPSQLSGGMRQRVALIRTLATEPDILLLDEPFSALDFQTRLALGDEVATILREADKTVVLVTHDISEAVSMADRVLIISHRPGRLKGRYELDFGLPRPSPFDIRNLPEFTDHFNAIWQELDVHVAR